MPVCPARDVVDLESPTGMRNNVPVGSGCPSSTRAKHNIPKYRGGPRGSIFRTIQVFLNDSDNETLASGARCT